MVWSRPKTKGQLLRNKRTIPVTNIVELVEYVLLPHNNEISKPRALNTFLYRLAELGIDKGLTKNKNLLSDLIEKEKGYRNVENTSDNESKNEESSSDIEMKRRRRRRSRRRWVLRMALKLKASKRATTTLTTRVMKQKLITLKRPPPSVPLKVPVKIARTLMCTVH